ncbi:MAG: metallophosphoesterase family protein [Betaproteobacteria bacterium]|nr:metallophosphoesterase family protein [Betaproteobacteria bacterium]
MRTAILSDIHSNLEALRACVAHARRQGVDGWAFAGDFVNYGADPLACLDLVRELGGETPLAVRGNHDACALGGLCETMHPVAREALYWTRERLGASERGFLAALPLTAHLEDALLVHASARTPGDWEYVDGVPRARRCLAATDAPLVFAGHVHKTLLYHRAHETVRAFAPPPGVAVPLVASRRWLALPGSVGQPRDGNCAAAYLLFDSVRREATSFRVPYDHQAAARKIVAAGLPDGLALRLALGR